MFLVLKEELNKRFLLAEKEEIDNDILIDEMDEDLIDDEDLLDEKCKNESASDVEEMLSIIPEYVTDNQDYDLDELLDECMMIAEAKEESSEKETGSSTDTEAEFAGTEMSEDIGIFDSYDYEDEDECCGEDDCEHQTIIGESTTLKGFFL